MSIKILCCNIRVDVPDDSNTGDGWNDRKEFCLKVMRAQDADIICTQECRDVHYAFLKPRLEKYVFHGISNPGEFHPTNAIFYSRERFEPVSAGGFWLSETPHIAGSQSWDSARPRFANWIDLRDRKTGKEFRMWNTHYDHIGQVAREKQAQCLVEACAVLPEEIPQLFAADCNADASNPAIAVMKAGGWQDTYTAIHGQADPGFTYHAFKGPRHADGKDRSKMLGKIDFIFTRGPVEALSAELIYDSRDGHYPSDHYFLTAEVRL